MDNIISEKSVRDLFQIIGAANGIAYVGPMENKYLRELMDGDVVLLDRESKDYNGQVCCITSPQQKNPVFLRVYINADDILLCNPTNGDVQEVCKREEVEIRSIVVGIVRKFEAIPAETFNREEHRNLFEKIKDGAVGSIRYSPTWAEAEAIKAKNRGGAYDCLYAGFYYGFYQGKKAERNAAKRKAARKGVKE